MLLRSTSRTAQRLFAAVRANCSSSSSGCTLLRAHLSSTRVLAAADGEFTDVLHFETIQPRNETLTPEFFIDKAVLVVNTASQCGYTPQLTQLQQLHEQFEARGLVVLAVPSNDFSNQEPGTDAEILAKYTAAPFHVRFPIAKKTPVTGDDAHAFFERIVVEYSRSVAPTWNFDKFLIDHHGDLRAVFPHDTEPLVPQVLEAIEEVLTDLPRPVQPLAAAATDASDSEPASPCDERSTTEDSEPQR